MVSLQIARSLKGFRCVRLGLVEHEFMPPEQAVLALRRGQSPVWFDEDHWSNVQVDANGHVIVHPFQDDDDSDDDYLDWIENVTTMDPKYGSRNTSVGAVLDVCRNDSSWLLQDGPAVEFLGLVSKLSPRFTDLDVMAAARTADVVPKGRIVESQSGQPPGFTAATLEIGTYTAHRGFKRLETVLDKPRVHHVCIEEVSDSWIMEEATILRQYDIFEYIVAQTTDHTSYTPKLLTTTTGWRSYELRRGTCKIRWHRMSMQGPVKAWQQLRQHATRLVRAFGCRDRALAVVLGVIFSCKIMCNKVKCGLSGNYDHRVDSTCPGNSWDTLYYHRNPTTRDDPRAFWGFYSTSPDPRTPCPVFHAQGQPMKYKLILSFLRMSDGYDYRYESMVRDGLQSMPGSFKD
ncbi:hypothetical protein FS749_014133 [Ceratobasidium sp. UAMH 11750]|nr:hypothetical protein FS749_014133 [Ceratobasidium sp. UAMH 11750]